MLKSGGGGGEGIGGSGIHIPNLLTNQPIEIKRIENYVMCMNITTPNISGPNYYTNQPMKLNELKTM